jgi:hypothetical protein
MRNMIAQLKYFFTVLLVLLVPYVLPAQVARDDIRKINEALNLEKVSMDLTYLVYENAKSTEPIQKESGKVIKNGKFLYQKVGDIEVVQHPEYVLMADHGIKRITFLRPENEIGNPFKGFDTTALALCEKVTFCKGDKFSSYTLVFPGGEYTSVRITYENKTFLPSKFEFYYRNPLHPEIEASRESDRPKLEIVYNKITRNISSDTSLFSYDRFLKKEKAKYTRLDIYKDYEFINQFDYKNSSYE